jgi:hypothetical protein
MQRPSGHFIFQAVQAKRHDTNSMYGYPPRGSTRTLFLIANLQSIVVKKLQKNVLWRAPLVISVFCAPWIYNVEMLCKYNRPRPGQQSWASVRQISLIHIMVSPLQDELHKQLLPLILTLSIFAKTFRTVVARVKQSRRRMTLQDPSRHSPDIELSIHISSTPYHSTYQEPANVHQDLNQSISSHPRQQAPMLCSIYQESTTRGTDLPTKDVTDSAVPQFRRRLLPVEVLSWTAQDPRQSELFNAQGTLYRFKVLTFNPLVPPSSKFTLCFTRRLKCSAVSQYRTYSARLARERTR